MSLHQEFREGFLSIVTLSLAVSSQRDPAPFPPPASHLTLLADFIDTFSKSKSRIQLSGSGSDLYSKLVEFELMRFKRVIFLLIVRVSPGSALQGP